MRKVHPKHLFLSAVLLFSLAFLGCGGDAELSPELQAHIDEYEELIDRYEPKFKAARGNLPEFAKVAASYSEAAKAWLGKSGAVVSEISDEESRAVEASIKKLNSRAKKMLTGS